MVILSNVHKGTATHQKHADNWQPLPLSGLSMVLTVD